MKEIARQLFVSLNYCEVDHAYFVLNDKNFVEKFYADNDDDAIAYFINTDWKTVIANQKEEEDIYPLLSDKDIDELNSTRRYDRQVMRRLERKLYNSLSDKQRELFDEYLNLHYRFTAIDTILRQDKEFKRYLEKKGVK